MNRSAMSKLTPTPGQTVGPFYGYALPYAKDRELLAPGSPGSIRLQGTVYDGAGHPIPDAILEIWQADADGNVPHRTGSLVRDGYTFTGFGRSAVGNTGVFTFTTVNPGPTEEGAAPFIAVAVFARGPDEPPVHPGLPAGGRGGPGQGSAADLAGSGPPQDPDRAPGSRRRPDLGHPPPGRGRDRVPGFSDAEGSSK